MAIFDDVFASVLAIADKVIPDPIARDKFKLDALKLKQDGELRELEISASVMLEEAKSSDPWTSRARPGFLWLMYGLIAFGIVMGIIGALNIKVAEDISLGAQAWWNAIPKDLWDFFKIGFLGYVGMRGVEKIRRSK